ncbi:MAG: aminotransferase class V-fold PLP-dependent enzyme [Anaerolineales bacterium]
MSLIKNQFFLDPDVIFLNHGSFGATPKPVLEAYQNWQVRLENQPVRFLGRDINELLLEARKALGSYLNAAADNLVFIPNATHGANIIAQSLHLTPDDEVLTTNHEYGACDYAWEFACQKRGVRYIRQPVSLPTHTEEQIFEQFWKGVSPRTKVIYLSHITSPTALRLPVQQICKRAKENDILTVVDAAHSPGQIPVDLQDIGADMVFGNCHKWMLSPKGAGFLYVRREIQPVIQPLIVSWGYHANAEIATGSQFIDYLQWTGTHDPAAYLSVPTAIQFMQENAWDKVQQVCHGLLRNAIERICELVEMDPLYPLDSDFYAQMGIAPLSNSDLGLLKRRLYDEYKVEVPVIQWEDKQFIRISVQGYNSQDDIDRLVGALEVLLPEAGI